MAFPFDRQGFCVKCQSKTTWVLKRRITQSGSRCYAWVCADCGSLNPNRSKQLWISIGKILEYLDSPAQLETLPLIALDTATVYCAVCGHSNAELHHWAPRALFKEEANEWPTDYLCKFCHDRWHRLVTPSLVR